MIDPKRIVQIAEKYVGQTEISGNRGWKDKVFEDKMKAVGWSTGQAWCAYFTELVWKEAAQPAQRTALDTLFSPSATATFANFKGTKFYRTGHLPKPGALVVWRYGNGWQGHIGIVTRVLDGARFETVEGNTNSAGSREGLFVMRRVRSNIPANSMKGLNLIGFVYPS